ncbi:MAG: hypothetical protein WBD55_07770, partial [Dehalococcoidia bacterium]
MHRIANIRLVALLIALSAVAAAFLFSGGISPRDHANAAGPFTLAGIYCADMYLDVAPLQAKGAAHGTGDLQVGKLMMRVDPSTKVPGNWDISVINYLGPGALIPSAPPATGTCATKGDNNAAAWNPAVKYAIQNANSRPTSIGTPVGPGPSLAWKVCTFDSVGPLGQLWIRTDFNILLTTKSLAGSNFGEINAYLGVDSACATTTPNTFNAHTVLEFTSRVATTGTPGVGNDDWDGDGCTDFDEMSPFPATRAGLDPFNPNDCDQNFNGAYNVLTTAFPSTKQGVATALLATVASVQSKTIKDGKHVQATVVVNSPNGLANNDEVFWNSTDPLQIGWWQVKFGGIGPGGVPAPGQKKVTMNRLFAPPCGLITTGLPGGAPNNGLYGVNCLGPVQKGNYFHCISRIDDEKAPAPPAVRPITSRILCYIDSPALNDSGDALVPSADGIGGAPPPPPYTTATPTTLTGSYDPVNEKINFDGCFRNVGGTIAPNVIVHTNIDSTSLKGFTDIWFNATNAECTAGVVNGGPASLQVATSLAEQTDTFDHDGDGCTDMDELAVTPPGTCGDDPYNPSDSDTTLTNTGSVVVTVAPADWDKT